MKKIRLFLGVIAIIALTGSLWMACDSSSDGGGGGTPPGGSDPAINGWNGGKSSGGGGGGSRLPTGSGERPDPNKENGSDVEWNPEYEFGVSTANNKINITVAGVAVLSDGTTGQAVEYAIGRTAPTGASAWSTTPPTTGLQDVTEGEGKYYVWARSKVSPTHNAGTTLRSTEGGMTLGDYEGAGNALETAFDDVLSAIDDAFGEDWDGSITAFPEEAALASIYEAINDSISKLATFKDFTDFEDEEQAAAYEEARDAIILVLESVIAATDFRTAITAPGSTWPSEFPLASYGISIGAAIPGLLGMEDDAQGTIWSTADPEMEPNTQLYTIGTPATKAEIVIPLPTGWRYEEENVEKFGSTYKITISYTVGDNFATYILYIMAVAQYEVDWEDADETAGTVVVYYPAEAEGGGHQTYKKDTHGGAGSKQPGDDNISKSTGNIATGELYVDEATLLNPDSNSDPESLTDGSEAGNPYSGITFIVADDSKYKITGFQINGIAGTIDASVELGTGATALQDWLSDPTAVDGSFKIDAASDTAIIYIKNAQAVTYTIKVEDL